MLVEKFDDFILLRAPELFDDKEIRDCTARLMELASQGAAQIYIDLGKTKSLMPGSTEFLTAQIAAVKALHKVELVLLCEPELSQQLNQTVLAQLTQLFERQNEQARRIANQRTISETEAAMKTRLEATLDDAIQTALVRWSGRPPNQIRPASANVNPATDVVSVVTMNIDGCLFRVFLSGSVRTIRGMVEQILKEKVADSDPAILDGACELLNYMTAFFKQRLTSDQSVVETEAPQLLQPEEMMVILDREMPAQRVRTNHGSFDVWLEAAA
jgi:hypothetical protein